MGSVAVSKLFPQGDQRVFNRAVNVVTALAMISRAILLAVGFWLHGRCKTCANTNSKMYWFARNYLIFNVILWVVRILIAFASVRLVLFMARNRLGPFAEPGKHMAARPGLIDEFETVPYSSDLFSEEDAEKEPPECSVCQQRFCGDGTVIKRTPCGHFFHKECLGTWLSSYAKSCPLCRSNLEEERVSAAD